MTDSTRASGPRNRWRWLGAAVSIAMIAFAGVTLYRLLIGIDLAKVGNALRETPPHTIGVALILVVAGYATLTLFDFFALRTIGRRDVPYRVAALASFTSYTIGHGLGATALTAAAVRYRMYSAWHLSVLDIAKLGFITGLTYWLGNAAMLGIGLLYAPEAASAINQLQPIINRAIAATALVMIAAYLIWLIPRSRALGRNGWKVTLPSARLTLLQIGLGMLDLAIAGMAMYVLLPGIPSVDPIAVIVAFVIATLLGFISHAPGGLGVFDAAILIGLPQFEIERLLASLLIFRALYFIAPFLLALAIFAGREAWLASAKRERSATLLSTGDTPAPKPRP
jgi:glycosyltransferase 2 family protein